MAKTFPDSGQPPAALTTPDIQIAEIAPRLGSIDTFRRSGKVAFLDDFGVFDWQDAGLGGSHAIVMSPALRDWGSLALTPPLNVGDVAVVKYLPMITNTRIGVEFNLTPQPTFSTPTLDYKAALVVNRISGMNLLTSGVLVSFKNGTVSYLNSSNVWTQVITFIPPPGVGFPSWGNVKIVFNFDLSQTVRVYYNQYEATIGQPLFSSITANFGEGLWLNLEAYDMDATGRKSYFSDLILTVDEA